MRVQLRKIVSVPTESPIVDTKVTPRATNDWLYTCVDKGKSTPTILAQKCDHRKPNKVTFERPWRHLTPPPLSDAVMTMSKRNYKVYYDIFISKDSTLRTCAALYTGVGPFFLSRTHFPSTDVHTRTGPSPLISDSNGSPMNISGTTSLFVRFWTYKLNFYFFVC